MFSRFPIYFKSSDLIEKSISKMAALAKNEISTPDAYLKQILPKK